MQKLMSRMGPMGQGMAATMSSGFAIKTTRQSYRNLNMETETDTLKSISTSGVDAGLFAVPAGYSPTTLQERMQGGPPRTLRASGKRKGAVREDRALLLVGDGSSVVDDIRLHRHQLRQEARLHALRQVRVVHGLLQVLHQRVEVRILYVLLLM